MDTNYNVTSNQPYSSTDSSSGSSGSSSSNLMQMLEQLIEELQQMLQSSSSSGSGDSDSGDSGSGGGSGGSTGLGDTGGTSGGTTGATGGGSTGGAGGTGGTGGLSTGGLGGSEGGSQQGGLHSVKLEMAGNSKGTDMLQGAPNADGSTDLYNKDGKHEGVMEANGSVKFDNAQAADDAEGVKSNSLQGALNAAVANKEGGTLTTKPGAMSLTAGDLPAASS